MRALCTVAEGGGQGEIGRVGGQRHLAVHGGGGGDVVQAGKGAFLVELEAGHRQAVGRRVGAPFGVNGLVRGRCGECRQQAAEEGQEETGSQGAHRVYRCKRNRNWKVDAYNAEYVP